jgi:hypothetical protein
MGTCGQKRKKGVQEGGEGEGVVCTPIISMQVAIGMVCQSIWWRKEVVVVGGMLYQR